MGYETMYFTEPVDHINNEPGTFSVKVLFRRGEDSAPLFVYTGNEGPIEGFYESAGWLVDTLGPKYNASVAFIEHRYYGESTISPLNFAYLDTTQVLWDFADITLQLKPVETTKVIAFGGSYGGMLSAMFRIKYPHIVDGAIASSAPLLMAELLGNETAHQITQAYAHVSERCPHLVSTSYQVLSTMIDRELYYPSIETLFKPCQRITDPGHILKLQDWLTEAFWGLAQYAYPYPTSVPSNPVTTACSILAQKNQDPMTLWGVMEGLRDVANMYYNNTGSVTCFDIEGGGGSDMQAWTYQTCTELLMPIGQYGWPKDMFNSKPWNYSAFKQYCKATYDVDTRPLWEGVNYGMLKDFRSSLQYASNIVFSYGSLDPWAVGCFQETFDNGKTVVIGIKDASHHYDLRAPNKLDSLSVQLARGQEEAHIRTWAGIN